MIEKVPVLDLMNMQAVSGKSGNRNTYSPLKTIYSSTSNPIEIANSLKLNGAKEIYIADLDLIEKKGHNIDLIKNINYILPTIFDGGVKDFESFKFFLDFAFKVIVPTETIESIDEIYKIFDTFPKERIVLSIDIKENNVLSNNLDLSIEEVKELLRDIKANEIILLDISSVGTKKGFNKELFNEFKEFKDNIIIGGGIKADEIKTLEREGIKKVLIGTSLHSGEISLL